MFIIQEMQTNEEGVTTFLPAVQCETRPEAESVFYMKCASACVSSVAVHTVMTYTEEGFAVSDLTRCFKHYE